MIGSSILGDRGCFLQPILQLWGWSVKTLSWNSGITKGWSGVAEPPERLHPDAHRQRYTFLPLFCFASSQNFAQIASGFRVALDDVFSFVSVPPESLLCLVALAVCLVVVCEGFRAADNVVGGRIALAGVAGATGTLLYRYDPRGRVVCGTLLALVSGESVRDGILFRQRSGKGRRAAK